MNIDINCTKLNKARRYRQSYLSTPTQRPNIKGNSTFRNNISSDIYIQITMYQAPDLIVGEARPQALLSLSTFTLFYLLDLYILL